MSMLLVQLIQGWFLLHWSTRLSGSSVSDIVMAELSVLDRLGCRSTRDEFRKRARALGAAVGEPITSTGKRSYRKKADILEDCRRALTEKHSEVQQEAH